MVSLGSVYSVKYLKNAFFNKILSLATPLLKIINFYCENGPELALIHVQMLCLIHTVYRSFAKKWRAINRFNFINT